MKKSTNNNVEVTISRSPVIMGWVVAEYYQDSV